MSIGSAWFVVLSKPRGENLAYQHLRNQDFDVYLPMCPRAIQRRGRYLTEDFPMFPRYLFVRPSHEEQSIAPVKSTLGVQQMVRFGDEFALASDSLVVDIRAMEARSCRVPESSSFKPGDKVEIIGGAFAGITTEVFSCAENRVVVLFQLLGAIRKLDLFPDQCQCI